MSYYNRYKTVRASSNDHVFEFISRGPKGDIKLTIQFTATDIENVFILSFGNQTSDNKIDDTSINNNKDRDKILVTVAYSVLDFTNRFPHKYVFFAGSSSSRNRLYRMAISVNLPELTNIFNIWGMDEFENLIPFEKTGNFHGFFIKRK